jgi:tetratricopeptide (TPR) repeat protein
MADKTTETISSKARELFQKAQTALERNNLDYAIEMFMQCLNAEPGFLKARQYLRASQRKRHQTTSSLKRVFTAATTAPTLTKARMALAKNPREAMSLAEEVLGQDPQHGQALILLAEAAETAELPEVAIQTLEYYSQINPNDIKGLHILARAYNAVERYNDARDVYDRILRLNSADFTAQKGVKDATARGAMQSGGWDNKDRGDFRDLLKNKEEAVALEQQSRMVRAEDMIENLIKENLAALAREPDNPVIRRKLGQLYFQKGNFAKALEYLEKLMEEEGGTDPSLAKEVYDIKTGMLAAQIKLKQEQMAKSPANAAALENELKALQTEHTKLELSNAENLVNRYPNDLMYRYDLGVLYMQAGDVPRAIEQFQRAVGQPQRRTAALNYLGLCFHQMGLHDLAADQFQKAIADLPMMDNVKKDVVYNLGVTLDAMGETEKAIAEFKKIAAIDFGFRDIKDRIVRKPPPKS